MDTDNNRNVIIAIALSIAVLMLWQFLYLGPKMEEDRQRMEQAQIEAQRQAAQGGSTAPSVAGRAAPTATGVPAPGLAGTATTPQITATPAVQATVPVGRGTLSRQAALARTDRVTIQTPALTGSINLTGARLDDLILQRYGETIEDDSPKVELFGPTGTATPYFTRYGWTPAAGETTPVPDDATVWQVSGNRTLSPGAPVTLVWDNGAGVTYRNTFAVDDNYLFTVRQEVVNASNKPIALAPFALIQRVGTPPVEGFWISYEGLIGVMGEDGEQRIGYGDVFDTSMAERTFANDQGWLGITDKYWAAALIPAQNEDFSARFVGTGESTVPTYQTDFLAAARTVQPGASTTYESNLFAGSKTVRLINQYEDELKVENFNLLIDWGWFYFITKPLFYGLDYFNSLTGNFGVAILIMTVIIKLMFFPLANQAYVSMSRMKKLQPEVQRIQKRFGEDKMAQQKELMELYKREKVNPLSGCLPVLIQIPVFFALYKVLFNAIEMRHAPFFGWIEDLAAKDPTSLFNLFGALPYNVPEFLVIGVWPLVMGVTMWIQMKLNPAPTDPIQQQVFAWMPILFTVLLAPFAAGLVIYWTWNNILSVAQQYLIMRREGADIALKENLKSDFAWVGPTRQWMADKTGMSFFAPSAAAAAAVGSTAERTADATATGNDPQANGAGSEDNDAATKDTADTDSTTGSTDEGVAADSDEAETVDTAAPAEDNDDGPDLDAEAYGESELKALDTLGLDPGATRAEVDEAWRDITGGNPNAGRGKKARGKRKGGGGQGRGQQNARGKSQGNRYDAARETLLSHIERSNGQLDA